jgi:Tetratricopeptide repeat
VSAQRVHPGPGPPHNLTVAYSEAGRLADAVKVLRRTLGDRERHLGADHPMTGTVRDHLRAASR